MPRRLNALGYFLARDLRLEMKMEMQMQQSISGISAPVSPH
ncbi:MAG TPA: hypothetical protein VFN39_00380 [Gemmatimonadaceae bacterium]|jgi:hypothetical protein|nr:hypothetical protein [Gemmatimonadaceae bacterium]